MGFGTDTSSLGIGNTRAIQTLADSDVLSKYELQHIHLQLGIHNAKTDYDLNLAIPNKNFIWELALDIYARHYGWDLSEAGGWTHG